MTFSRRRLLIVAAALICGTCALAADKPVILLTGFEPFGGRNINESWETVKTFQGQEIGGYTIETALLPVVYDEMDKPLQDAIAKHKPQIVISFGIGAEYIQVETSALNSYHPMNPLDNKGKAPPREEIAPNGELRIKSTLPTRQIAQALAKEKLPVILSEYAGGYLCNECFYRLMASKNAPAVRGFIHVPPYDAKDPYGGVINAEKLKRAVKTIVETVAKEAPVPAK
jgi:pyroglutamyl-peptidase